MAEGGRQVQVRGRMQPMNESIKKHLRKLMTERGRQKVEKERQIIQRKMTDEGRKAATKEKRKTIDIEHRR